MQSLALDVHVISEDGGEVQVREEVDELLRASEELGIDLSPGSLRAVGRQPTAEELEEGQERVDESGELTLPADEALGDLTDVEIAPAESAGDEEGEPVAPLGAVDLADLEIEECEGRTPLDRHQRFRRHPDRARREQAEPRLVLGA